MSSCTATFTTTAAGAPTSYSEISAVESNEEPGQGVSSATGAAGDLVLSFKLYDLSPSGAITLPDKLIAPARIPAGGGTVSVDLPGIVHRFPAGDRIALEVAGGDADRLAALERSLPARLDAVVNNAGVVVTGPVEAVALAEPRRQLDVNVVGQVAVAQAALPRLRTSRGRLVFVSSVSGQIATPRFGPYNASKFALEGIVDALRLELWPWGIRVALVAPAQTDGVAATIEQALTARRPRARYVVGRGPRVQVILSRLMPTAVMDVALRAGSGVPRRP